MKRMTMVICFLIVFTSLSLIAISRPSEAYTRPPFQVWYGCTCGQDIGPGDDFTTRLRILNFNKTPNIYRVEVTNANELKGWKLPEPVEILVDGEDRRSIKFHFKTSYRYSPWQNYVTRISFKITKIITNESEEGYIWVPVEGYNPFIVGPIILLSTTTSILTIVNWHRSRKQVSSPPPKP